MRRFGTMLWLIFGILMTNAIPVYAATWEDATGPYSTTVVMDTRGLCQERRLLSLRRNPRPSVEQNRL